MKILYFTPSFQHPDVRGPDRHYQFIRELSKRHEITLLTLKRASIPKQAYDEVASLTKSIHLFNSNGETPINHLNAAISKIPLLGKKAGDILKVGYALDQMKERFESLLREENYDVVVFHGKSVFSVIENWNGLPIVVDFCDATSMRYKTKMSYVGLGKLPLLALRYAQIRRLERKIVDKTPEVAFISSRDRQAILGPNDGSEVIPNGLNLDFWRRKSERRTPDSLVFTGVMDYAPNEDAAIFLIDKIMPILSKSIPNLKVTIVGRDPGAGLLERAERIPGLEVTGFVDDVRPYLEDASVFAAPVRYASGMQNKIQEALAMEVPVVTTSVVAAGLPHGDDENSVLLIGDGEREFANQVIKLLSNQGEQKRLAEAGRRYAESHFDWARSAGKLEKMCFAALQSTRS